MKNLVFFFCILIILTSCGQNVVENKNDKKNFNKGGYSLKQEGHKVLKLDSESQPNNSIAQFFVSIDKDSITDFFTFLNEYNNSIYFYDYKTSDYKFKISFDKEGPNGTYPYRSGYYILNLDSIFYYSYKTTQVYLFNKEGKKYYTYDLKKGRTQKKVYYPTPIVQSESPLYFIDSTLFLCGKMNGEYSDEDTLNRPLVTIANKHTIKYAMGYPPSYRQGYWGEAYFREVFWTYNPNIKKFIFSFPNDHNMYVSDLNKNTSKFYAGSMYAGSIKSVNRSKSLPGKMNKVKRTEHYLSSYYYRNIIYDKYRNVYYRMIEWPWKDFDMNKRPWEKPVSIVILDDKFNVLGETKLPKSNWLSIFFSLVTPDGLLLKEESDNEDELRLTIFKLTKNEN
jgi:hypothetical protein